MRFGYYEKEGDGIQSSTKATPEVQVGYLQACLKVEEQEITDLKVELATFRLERQVEQTNIFQQFEALKQIEGQLKEHYANRNKPFEVPKKRWFQRKKREA